MRGSVLATWVGAGVALAALAVTAAGAVEVGDTAPAFVATDWLNAPPLSLAAVRGKVAVVEFWATWCPPCRKTIPHLSELHKTYAPKGVVIMGLTDESKTKVEPFAKEMGMTYAVGCGSKASGIYGVRGIPHAFVLDVAGKVVWHGHPAGGGLEQAIEEQLKTNPPTLLSPEKKAEALAAVQKVEEAMEEKVYGRAAVLLNQIKDPDRDPEVQKRVLAVREQLASQAETLLADAEKHVKAKAYYEADEAFATAASLAGDGDVAVKARSRRAELQKDKAVRLVIEQGRREAVAASALGDLQKKAPKMEPGALLKAYDALAKAHDGTKASATAAAKAKAMRADTTLMASITNQAAEKDCKGWISMARNFINAGMKDKAKPYLDKVIAQYPESAFAEQAKEMQTTIEP